MIGKKVEFNLIERGNIFNDDGKEWHLMIRFANLDWWTVDTWKKKPKKKELERYKSMIIRSFEFYHAHLYIPRFDIDVIEDNTDE